MQSVRLGASDQGFEVQGLRFLEKVGPLLMYPGHPIRPPVFRYCIFEGGASFSSYPCMWPNLFDCTFRGDTELLSYTNQGKTHFSRLRFERCRLETMPICGNLDFDECAVVGTADTALVVHGTGDNPVTFLRCAFDSLATAIVVPTSGTELILTDCQFRDVGKGLDLTGPLQIYSGGAPKVTLSATSFERIGRAIQALLKLLFGPRTGGIQRLLVAGASGGRTRRRGLGLKHHASPIGQHL